MNCWSQPVTNSDQHRHKILQSDCLPAKKLVTLRPTLVAVTNNSAIVFDPSIHPSIEMNQYNLQVSILIFDLNNLFRRFSVFSKNVDSCKLSIEKVISNVEKP